MRAPDFDGALADLFELKFERLAEVGAALRETFAAAQAGVVDAELAAEVGRRAPRARCAWCSERRKTQPADQIADRRRENRDFPILRAVAIRHGLTISELRSSRKNRPLSTARFEAYWGLRTAGRSLPEIARALGRRNHQCVIHGLRRFEAMLAADPMLAASVRGTAALVEAAS
jgi:hypothetical protein